MYLKFLRKVHRFIIQKAVDVRCDKSHFFSGSTFRTTRKMIRFARLKNILPWRSKRDSWPSFLHISISRRRFLGFCQSIPYSFWSIQCCFFQLVAWIHLWKPSYFGVSHQIRAIFLTNLGLLWGKFQAFLGWNKWKGCVVWVLRRVFRS